MKECPFCCGTILSFKNFPWQVCCKKCGAEGPASAEVQEAKELWNKRLEPVEL